MKRQHKDIQKWIKKKYGKRFEVEAEIEGQNRLPDKKRHWYQPDVILRERKRKQIAAIIEVENDPTRKSIVGASILADVSLRELKQKQKPILCFVIYEESGIKQTPNFVDKIKLVKPYCKNLKNILVLPVAKFKLNGPQELK